MVKVVNSYKGKTVDELQKIPNDELFTLLNSRQRRSLKRGLSDNKKKLIAEIKEAKEEEIDTVGGFVSYVANKVPNINEVFVFNNQLKFKILEADERRVITLEIKKII